MDDGLVFSYGTLQDPAVQVALLGRHLYGVTAWIDGWSLFIGADGYLFIKPRSGSRVHGRLLCVNESDLARIDLWEDLDVYVRERCQAVLDNGVKQAVWVYTRRDGKGRDFHGTALHGLPPEVFQEALRDFVKSENYS